MANSDPLISVIIVNWNVADSICRCLDSIFATKYPRLEVIVIDNGSTDNSVSRISKYSQVKLIKQTNIGFPKAVNVGLKAGTGNYFLILNPDASLPTNFFSRILHTAQKFPQAGVIGPKFTHPDGSPQGSVFPEPSIIASIREYWFHQGPLTQKYTPTGNSPVSVNAVSGACMFIPTTVVRKIGLFTEQVFMYYEDLDYCRRIRRSGLLVIFDPNLKIIHEHGSSSQKTNQATAYLIASSKWYNGLLKYYLLTIIIKLSRWFRSSD